MHVQPKERVFLAERNDRYTSRQHQRKKSTTSLADHMVPRWFYEMLSTSQSPRGGAYRTESRASKNSK